MTGKLQEDLEPSTAYRAWRSLEVSSKTIVCVAAIAIIFGAPARADVFAGEEIYRQHCEFCHGAGGVPVLPDAPNFLRGDGLMQPDRMLVQAIRDGKNAMPGFYGVLSDREVIDVVTYLRSLF